MDYTNLKSSVFENTHAIKIILILRNEGPMVKGELASKIAKGTSTVQARIADLIEMGLLTEKREPVKPFKKIVELTPKGRAASNLLFALEDLLIDSE